MSDPHYLPEDDDILRARVRTTGISETKFVVNNVEFNMFDVGGQRSERKKWMHCFDHVDAVLFVASASSYDEVLFEDETVNRTVEALELFGEISGSPWLSNAGMILFLNKRDLLEEKIMHSDLAAQEWAKDFDGPKQDSEAAGEYMVKRFMDMVPDKTREIHKHIVCGVDSENVDRVFLGIQKILSAGAAGATGMF